jgi:hypothetical protein
VLQIVSFATVTVSTQALCSLGTSEPQHLARSTQSWVAASLMPTTHCASCAEQAFSLQLVAVWRQSLHDADMLDPHAETQACSLQLQGAVHAMNAAQGPPFA